MTAGLLLVAATLALAPGAIGGEAVHLPTEGDAVAVALGSESVLFGPDGVETLLPGPVEDREEVRVGLGPDGRIRSVVVEQRLVVHGLGDFQFKVPGPARDVEALDGSESEPGLRRGSVLWQGFSDGDKLLAARMPLFADQEAERLPVAFEIAITVDGRPLLPGTTASGELEVRIAIRNISGVPVSVTTGDAEPARVGALLDALGEHLADGVRPVPGAAGIPEEVKIAGEPQRSVATIEAPFRVSGRLSFVRGAVRGLRAEGGDVAGQDLAFDVTLGGGRPLETAIVLRGVAEDVGFPVLEAAGEPALPDPGSIAPPGFATWREAVRAGRVDASELLALASETLWRVARLRQFDTYLGNPDPNGPAVTEYRFSFAEESRSRSVPVTVPRPAGPLGLLSLAALALALLLGGAVAWSRA